MYISYHFEAIDGSDVFIESTAALAKMMRCGLLPSSFAISVNTCFHNALRAGS